MRIGIDLGGTKTEIIALSDQGDVLFQKRVATPNKHYQQILTTIRSLIQETEEACGNQGTIGIGTPGSPSPCTGLMRNSNTTCLNGKPLQQDLEQLTGRQVRIANDANCFTLSEAVDGAAKGASTVFGVIIGTGTGGGLVVNRQLLVGQNAVAGEWGHNPLPWPKVEELPGATCYCGQQGCIETYLSGPGLSRDHELATGEKLTPQQIAQRAEMLDSASEATLRRYEDRLARGLASVVNLFDPDVIVLGGGLSNLKRLYKNVPGQWHKYIFSDRITTRLLPPKHGDSGGVRGAAWLWPED